MSHTVDLVPTPSSEIRQAILDPLRAFNAVLFQGALQGQDLAVALRDESGEVIGGLWSRTSGGWLAIELLFVPESLRGAGIATDLIRVAEEEALRRGCRSAWIDTINPEALRLYRRLGYQVFGELKDYPVGFTRSFLHKRLDGSPSGP